MSMLQLELKGLRWDADLQIIQGDVYLAIDKEVIVDEPLCLDVGMPALLLSTTKDVTPDRWSPPEEWASKPFFVCGCGDPECRAYSFQVRHDPPGELVRLAEIEERPDGSFRELGTWTVDASEYRNTVRAAAQLLLDFAGSCDGYSPLLPDTLPLLRRMLS